MRYFVVVYWQDGAVLDTDTFQILAKTPCEARTKAANRWNKRFASVWPDCKVVGLEAYESKRLMTRGVKADDG